MIDIFSRFGERVFPERQILIRSRGEITHITLPSLLQASVVAAAIFGTGALAYDFVAMRDSTDSVAVQSLKSELALAKQAADAAGAKLQQLETERQARGDQADATEAAAAVDVAELTSRVRQLENGVQVASHQSAENRSLYETTAAQLAQMSTEEKRLKADHDKLAAEKGKLENKVGELEDAKDKADRSIAAERTALRQKVVELEQKMAKKQADRGTNVSNLAPIAAPAPGAQADAEADEPVTTTSKQIASAEGFDLDKFLSRFGVGMKTGAVGGPYVALDTGKADAKANDDAQRVLSTLPLTAPLDHFQLESRFGVRSDPFNGHQSIHTGLDMSAPYRTPVYNTAPGTVVFAGYAAAYGKVVEIDHGLGIHTKYAHLNQITVNVGQKLGRKIRIGLLGSTGRSTGPHVHYEVLVNGVPQDPEKFLQAGQSIALVKATK
jgi:murein DD-endopeptidase MepM/ murein hydrolase activator NlpD